MTLDELMVAADAAQRAGTRLTVVLPAKWPRPPRFPRGELLCVNPAGEQVYSYHPRNILEWARRRTGAGT